MVDFQGLDLAVRRLHALGEPTRLRLAHLLSFGELTVGEITRVLGQSQPRVSRHLRLLLEAGCVERFPEGACVFYRLAEEPRLPDGRPLVQTLIDTLDDRDAVLEPDRARLDQVRTARLEASNAYFEAHAAEWMRVRALYQPVEEIERAMLELLGPDRIGLLLDLGTGTGRVLEVLHTLYERAIGFDVNQAMLRLARINLDRAGIRSAHVRYASLLSPPPTDPADLVVIHQVLHYLDNPAAAFRSASALLAPRGRMLVVDFLPHQLESLRETHAHRRLGFGEEEVRRWCREAGLELTRSRAIERPATTGDGEHPSIGLWMARRVRVSRGGRSETGSVDRMEEAAHEA
jgi:ArsR family transcriptional regulator